MSNVQNEDLRRFIEEISALDNQKIVISNPRNSSAEYKRIAFNRKIISNNDCFQIESHTDKQVFHKNIRVDELKGALSDAFSAEYKQINVYAADEEIEAKLNKKGALHIIRSKKDKSGSTPRMINMGNDRKKSYILREGEDIPVLRELDIFTDDGRIKSSMYDKYRQINRFTELVDDALKDFHKDKIRIIDFGCGKSYLTFIVYYYLTQIRKISAEIVGLDLKADVIKRCNELAKRFGYEGLYFEVGDISDYKTSFKPDMVMTLHACDTATDYALYNAVKWEAGAILSVPCCQHEVNKQIKTDSLTALTKYGIVKERTSALITDAIRGCMLESRGYKVDLIEFIDIEHSPKNIMLRAKRKNISVDKRSRSYNEALALANEFHLNQKLMELFESDNTKLIM